MVRVWGRLYRWLKLGLQVSGTIWGGGGGVGC